MATRLRRADRRDLPQVETLLKEADLPALDPHPVLSNLLVAEVDGKVVGAAALDVIARSGLVRAVVVAADQRGRGVGRELLRSLVPRAHELSLKQLYVVATAAREFFARLGFEPVPVEEVPFSVRESRSYSGRSSDAVVMELRLR